MKSLSHYSKLWLLHITRLYWMLSLVKENTVGRSGVGKSMGIFQVIHTLLLVVVLHMLKFLFSMYVCVFLDNRYSMTFLFAACGVAVLTRWMRIDAVWKKCTSEKIQYPIHYKLFFITGKKLLKFRRKKTVFSFFLDNVRYSLKNVFCVEYQSRIHRSKAT